MGYKPNNDGQLNFLPSPFLPKIKEYKVRVTNNPRWKNPAKLSKWLQDVFNLCLSPYWVLELQPSTTYHTGGFSLKSFSAACTALATSLASMLTLKNCPTSQ